MGRVIDWQSFVFYDDREEQNFVVMQNPFYSSNPLHLKFNLKHTSATAELPFPSVTEILDAPFQFTRKLALQRERSLNKDNPMYQADVPIYSEKDFKKALERGERNRYKISNFKDLYYAIDQDTTFLANKNLIGYSLSVGVHKSDDNYSRYIQEVFGSITMVLSRNSSLSSSPSLLLPFASPPASLPPFFPPFPHSAHNSGEASDPASSESVPDSKLFRNSFQLEAGGSRNPSSRSEIYTFR